MPEFTETLREAVHNDLLDLINVFNQGSNSNKIEAFCIYSAGGFRGIGYAVRREGDKNTHQNMTLDTEFLSLVEDHSDIETTFTRQSEQNNDLYFQICADEWEHINEFDTFIHTNNTIESEIDKLYNAGIEPKAIQFEILRLFIDAVSSLVNKGVFLSSAFVGNVFYSIQFAGSSNASVLLESSKTLNNHEWHKKVEQFVKENA
ncbi:hypothetical protein L4D06_11275 [Enterovibrio makurazakiensis]|uniref:hypothetical protein n=1 Tax=Enterovibrio makurazakiensis TaxID=2910232 RepID=UPI003D1B2D78